MYDFPGWTPRASSTQLKLSEARTSAKVTFLATARLRDRFTRGDD